MIIPITIRKKASFLCAGVIFLVFKTKTMIKTSIINADKQRIKVR